MRCQRICLDFIPSSGIYLPGIVFCFLSLGTSEALGAITLECDWPDGGDARCLAAVPQHPNHLYLGTTNSWIYESTDSGSNWHRLSKLGDFKRLGRRHIAVDSADAAIIYVAAWTSGQPRRRALD